MHACIEWAGRDAPGTYDLATRLLPVSGLRTSGMSENLCVYLEGEGGRGALCFEMGFTWKT